MGCSSSKGTSEEVPSVIQDTRVLKTNSEVTEFRDKTISKDIGLYDDAMTCLCFRCEKCKKALENAAVMNAVDSEEVDFLTVYAKW